MMPTAYQALLLRKINMINQPTQWLAVIGLLFFSLCSGAYAQANALPLSKGELARQQAAAIIANSSTAQALQQLALQYDIPIGLYVDGLTGRLKKEKKADFKRVRYTPAFILLNAKRVQGGVVPLIDILLTSEGAPLFVSFESGVEVPPEIFNKLEAVVYLRFSLIGSGSNVLNLENYFSLEGLYIRGGSFTEIKLPKLSSLIAMNIYSETVSEIRNLELQTKLDILMLNTRAMNSYDKLKNHPALRYFNANVEGSTLDLGSLSKLEYLVATYFSEKNVRNLNKLSMLNTLVLYVPKFNEAAKVNLPKKIKYMRIVLDKDLIFTEFKDLPELETLFITSSPHVDLPVLQGLPKLQKLEINKSKLSSLAGLQQIPQVKSVTLTDSQITSLEPLKSMTDMTALEFLDLEDNAITEFSGVGDKPHIKYIGLSHNPLEEVDVEALAKYPYCSLGHAGTYISRLGTPELYQKILSIYQNGHP